MLPPKKYRPPLKKSAKNINAKQQKSAKIIIANTKQIAILNISQDCLSPKTHKSIAMQHKRRPSSAAFANNNLKIVLSARDRSSVQKNMKQSYKQNMIGNSNGNGTMIQQQQGQQKHQKQKQQQQISVNYNSERSLCRYASGSTKNLKKMSKLRMRNIQSASLPYRKLSSAKLLNNTKYLKQPGFYKQLGQFSLKQLQQSEPVPVLTSKNWGIFELTDPKIIAGHRMQKKRQMASLTKIINLITIIDLLKFRSLNAKSIAIPVSSKTAKIIGTTAKLKEGDLVTLYDLLYGMMLPSGNDAAHQIAVIGGSILKLYDSNFNRSSVTSSDIMAQAVQEKQVVLRYLKQMNKNSKQLGMTRSKWCNPHGLSNTQNYTTIQDMFYACSYAMKNTIFREVVSTKNYSCTVDKVNKQSIETAQPRIINWQNTNKMLWKGWSGIKTGITPNAGPCLAASVSKRILQQQKQYLVILGGCQSMEQRWLQVQMLVDWATKQQQFV